MSSSLFHKIGLVLCLSSSALIVSACSASDEVVADSLEAFSAPSGSAAPAPPPGPSCGPGTEFCNSSCGICVLPGTFCGKDTCPNNGKGLKRCGNSYCGKGTECVGDQCVPPACGAGTKFCNSSCGICILSDAECVADTCPNNGQDLKRCGQAWCGEGTTCVAGTCVLQ